LARLRKSIFAAKNVVRTVKRKLLFIAGIVSLSLGILGIVIPLLPTTPFLLLAAACFLRSSRRLYDWLTRHPVFGTNIRAYQRFRAVSLRAKIMSITLLWACILSSSVLFVSNIWVRIVLWAIAAGVTVYLVRLKTVTPEMKERLNREPDPALSAGHVDNGAKNR
jgi:uncharacterized membrane protein YbaN (DUF454 family)